MTPLRKFGKFSKFIVAAALAGLTGLSTAAGYSGLFFLGDSLSDVGNVSLVVGSAPGQVITGNGYIPDQPYALGQFTNANVWAQGFASALGLATAATPSLLGGHDFAFGGARAATDGAGLPPSLKSQLNMYLGAIGPAPAGALFVVEAGGNDGRDAISAAAVSQTPDLVITAAATAYAQAVGDVVDQLRQVGAQNIVVWNVPNLGLVPAVTAQGAAASYLGSLVSSSMNLALGLRLAGESGVTIFDDFGFLTGVVANPAAYGLVNATDACGALATCNPQQYLFWDGIHPTSAGHDLLAQAMLTAVPEPATCFTLAAGLLVVALRVRRRA